jgi:hypothetical protein
MEIVKATIWIYRTTLKRSAELVAENWGVVFAPLAYSIILSVTGVLLVPFGFIGGILLLLISDACMSSGLYMIENIVMGRKTNISDFFRGFTVYLWEIVLISFILWLPMRLTSEVLYTIPEGPLILLFIKITVLIILNAVPELIYQSRASGLELIAASYNFIIENWPEWFTPNLAIAVAGMILTRALGPRVSALPFYMEIFVMTSVLGLVLTYLMIFRGILFSELNGSNRRARVYRYKVRD